jgi:hypothetical protein
VPQLPVPDTISISVSASPANAQLFVDGEAVRANPFFARIPRSAGLHRIQAVAAGYVSGERLVSFADNVMVDLALSPRPIPRDPSPPARRDPPQRRGRNEPLVHVTPAAPPPPPPAAAPPRTAPAEVAPVRLEGVSPRRRSIDSNNPYGDDK